MFDFELTVKGLVWSSDWNGHEVGYPDIDVVGLYTRERPAGEEHFYIDMESMEVLEVWTVNEDDE